MKVTFLEYLGHKKILISYAIVCILVALGVALLPASIGTRYFTYISDKEEEKLVNHLNQERNYILDNLSRIAEDVEVIDDIETKDRGELLDRLQSEKTKTGFTAFTVADENGTVITRSSTTASIGDNVFLTLPIGRLASQGLTGVTYGSGRNFPLTMAGVYPIKDDNGNLRGALFAGNWFDDSYAKLFKEKYLPQNSGQEIIFYSKDEGVTGTSIEDVTIRKNMRAYITHGSVLVQEKHEGELLNFNGKDYIISNYILSGSDTIYGGILLLTPLPATLLIRSFMVSFLFALIFFLVALLGEKVTFPVLLRMKKRYLLSILTLLSLSVWAALWFGIYYHTKQVITYIEKQKFSIYNSTLNLRPSSGIYVQGYSQQAAVIVHSGGEDLNAIEVHLRFDPSVMSVDSLSFDRSICSKKGLVENTFDNEAGTIVISCVIRQNAFDQEWGIVVDVSLTPHTTGSASLSFDEGSQVLAADGLGTNVLRSMTSGFYRIFNEKDITGSFSKKTIVIPYSQTHENSAKWYNSKHISVSWLKVPGAEYMYELSDVSTSTFISPITTSAQSLTLEAPTDGVFYFRLAAVKNGIRGAISTFKIKIDTTPPDVPTIRASSLNVGKGEVVRFELNSNDYGSGLQKNFYVQNDRSIWLPTFSKLYIPFIDTGKHLLGVRVFDNAENYSDAEVIVTVHK